MKVITEITFGALAAGHIVLDPKGLEWIVDEVRSGYVGSSLVFGAQIRRYNERPWIKGSFSDPIAIVDQTAGDAVETVGRILQGCIVMEPITSKKKEVRRAKLAGHLAIHHRMSVTGAKTDGSLEELLQLHASLHTPVSQPGSIPHIHQELP